MIEEILYQRSCQNLIISELFLQFIFNCRKILASHLRCLMVGNNFAPGILWFENVGCKDNIITSNHGSVGKTSVLKKGDAVLLTAVVWQRLFI